MFFDPCGWTKYDVRLLSQSRDCSVGFICFVQSARKATFIQKFSIVC